jgi:hypothetical protein
LALIPNNVGIARTAYSDTVLFDNAARTVVGPEVVGLSVSFVVLSRSVNRVGVVDNIVDGNWAVSLQVHTKLVLTDLVQADSLCASSVIYSQPSGITRGDRIVFDGQCGCAITLILEIINSNPSCCAIEVLNY